MKKASLLTLFILLVSAIYKIHQYSSDQHLEEWHTYSKAKNDNKQVVFWDSTEKELKQARVPDKEDVKRKPSSLSPKVSKVKMLAGREITGEVEANTKHLKWTNSYHDDWKEKLGNSLLRFQEPDAKVMVKKNKSVVEIKKGKGRLMEHVTITYLLEGDETTSFNAWLDSETGEMIRTWNKTIKEPIGHNHERQILTPTGTL